MIGHFWLQLARNGTSFRAGQVESAANPADGPPRENLLLMQALGARYVEPVLPAWTSKLWAGASSLVTAARSFSRLPETGRPMRDSSPKTKSLANRDALVRAAPGQGPWGGAGVCCWAVTGSKGYTLMHAYDRGAEASSI
jgi:hypothetical protein